MNASGLRTIRQAVLDVQDIEPLSEGALRLRLTKPEHYDLQDVVVRLDGRIFIKIELLRERLMARSAKRKSVNSRAAA